jgi:hypothetical protein
MPKNHYNILTIQPHVIPPEVVTPEFINCGEATKFMNIWDPGAKHRETCSVAPWILGLAGFVGSFLASQNLASGMTSLWGIIYG